MRRLWAALNVILRGRLIAFGDIGRHFSKFCTETFKKNTQYKTTKTTFLKKSKAVFFLSIRYRKTSQTQDVKSQSTERSVRKIAQPKRDSALEQKTRIVLSRETSKHIFDTTKEKSKAELKQTFLERNQRHSGKLMFSFRWERPLFFGRFVRKSSKQLHAIQNDEAHVPKKSKAVFISIRYRKTSQTQDVKSRSTKRSVRGKIAQPKRDSAFEQETRIIPRREIWGSSQNSFFS